MKLGLFVICVGVCVTTGGIAASAADRSPKPRPMALEHVVACRTIVDRDERLACFDREVAAFDTAEKTSQIVVVDREQVRAAKRSLFGLRLPDLGLFGGKPDKPGEDELDTLIAPIASISRNGVGEVVFTLKDGATWLQTDDREVAGALRPGGEVTIKRGVLGSYFATIKGHPGFKVRRVN